MRINWLTNYVYIVELNDICLYQYLFTLFAKSTRWFTYVIQCVFITIIDEFFLTYIQMIILNVKWNTYISIVKQFLEWSIFWNVQIHINLKASNIPIEKKGFNNNNVKYISEINIIYCKLLTRDSVSFLAILI